MGLEKLVTLLKIVRRINMVWKCLVNRQQVIYCQMYPAGKSGRVKEDSGKVGPTSYRIRLTDVLKVHRIKTETNCDRILNGAPYNYMTR